MCLVVRLYGLTIVRLFVRPDGRTDGPVRPATTAVLYHRCMSDSKSHRRTPSSSDLVAALLAASQDLRPHLLASYWTEGHKVDLSGHPELQEAEQTLAHWIERAYHPDPMIACELDLAPALVSELLPLSLDDKLELLERDRRFRSWGLVVHLLEEGYAHRFTQPRRCLRFSAIALRVARSLDLRFYGRSKVWELTVLAQARVANALRLGSEMDQAAEYLRSAMGSAQSVECPRIHAEVALTVTSFHRTRRDRAAAQESLERALEHLGCLDDPPESLLVNALIQAARRYGDHGDFRKAVSILRRVLPQTSDPVLRYVVLDNLALYAQSLREADVIREVLDHLRDRQDTSLELRFLTLLGTRLDLMGHSEMAAVLLDKAGLSMSEKNPFEAILIFLDTARIYAREGEGHKLKEVTRRASMLDEDSLTSQQRTALLNLTAHCLAVPELVSEATVADLRLHLLTRPTERWEGLYGRQARRLPAGRRPAQASP